MEQFLENGQAQDASCEGLVDMQQKLIASSSVQPNDEGAINLETGISESPQPNNRAGKAENLKKARQKRLEKKNRLVKKKAKDLDMFTEGLQESVNKRDTRLRENQIVFRSKDKETDEGGQRPVITGMQPEEIL